MLLADRQSGGVISRKNDLLGRHFNDHLALNVARLRPLDRTRTNRMLADRWLLGSDRHLHLELRPEVQREHRIGSAYVDVGVEVPDDSALVQTTLAIAALRKANLREAIARSFSVLPDAGTLVSTAYWHLRRKAKYWPVDADVQLKIWIEQLPAWQNRISLSDKCDALGQPQIRIDFHRTDFDERTLRVTLEKLRTYWERHWSSVCALHWSDAARSSQARLVDLATEQAHPAGSTRMGRDPATSVVDPTLRVHAIRNLSVASASVFPASGSANPTFTIMQLAMRAADMIATRFGSLETGRTAAQAVHV
jgi:choline dehydrogenase-like flavoprotein